MEIVFTNFLVDILSFVSNMGGISGLVTIEMTKMFHQSIISKLRVTLSFLSSDTHGMCRETNDKFALGLVRLFYGCQQSLLVNIITTN